MAGLFGLFGGKKKQDPSQSSETQQGAYFLDPDSAKTFGDIDYMRTVKTVRRTFPKTVANQGEFEQIDSVSALDKMSGNMPSSNGSNGNSSNGSGAMNGQTSASAAPKPASENATSQRRTTDTSMDMFRNMAKDIRKR